MTYITRDIAEGVYGILMRSKRMRDGIAELAPETVQRDLVLLGIPSSIDRSALTMRIDDRLTLRLSQEGGRVFIPAIDLAGRLYELCFGDEWLRGNSDLMLIGRTAFMRSLLLHFRDRLDDMLP